MFKVGGIQIARARDQQFLPDEQGKWQKFNIFFKKNQIIWRIFLGGDSSTIPQKRILSYCHSTHGILTHSGRTQDRICMPVGCQGLLCPSYSRPKSSDAGKMRSVSKNMDRSRK